MPRKTKKSVHTPVKIQFTFLIQDDGILASYEGFDDRTHSVGMAVLEAIAAEYDWQLTTIASAN
jgi:hypothetical protein